MPAKKPVHRVVQQLPAGAAPLLDLGKILGQTGANLVEIKPRYDELSAPHRDEIVPADITVFDDRSFALALRTPPTSFLIRRALTADGRLTAGPQHRRRGGGDAHGGGTARSMAVSVGFAG